MTHDEATSPALKLPAQDQQLREGWGFRVPPGQPGEWDRDELGCPRWMLVVPNAEWGPWTSVVRAPASSGVHRPGHAKQELEDPRQVGPLQLPNLFSLVRFQRGELEEWREVRARYEAAPSDRARAKLLSDGRRGRPEITRSAPWEAMTAAWLVDGHGYSRARVAEYLGLGSRDHAEDRPTRKTGARYVQAGRELLNGLGVLPWALWNDGNVADAWWESSELLDGLNMWADWVAVKRDEIDWLTKTLGHLTNAALAHAGRPPRPS